MPIPVFLGPRISFSIMDRVTRGGGSRPPKGTRPSRPLTPFEQKVIALGREVFAYVLKPSFLRHPINFLRDKMIRMGMDDTGESELSKGLNNLVENYPSFKSTKDLRSAVKKYLGKEVNSLPWYVRFGFRHLFLFKLSVGQIARRFILAKDMGSAKSKIRALEKKKVYMVVAQAGESAKTKAQARKKVEIYKEALKASAASGIERQSHSLKLTSITTELGPSKLIELKRDMRKLLLIAQANGARITIDMEYSWHKDITFQLFIELLEEE